MSSTGLEHCFPALPTKVADEFTSSSASVSSRPPDASANCNPAVVSDLQSCRIGCLASPGTHIIVRKFSSHVLRSDGSFADPLRKSRQSETHPNNEAGQGPVSTQFGLPARRNDDPKADIIFECVQYRNHYSIIWSWPAGRMSCPGADGIQSEPNATYCEAAIYGDFLAGDETGVLG